MAPYFTPQTTLTTDQGGLAWTLSQADSKLHTTLGQSCQPREAKLFPQDQASSPGGFTTLCLEKKGAAGIDKFKDCTPAHLQPYVPKPSFLIIFRASTAHCHLVSSRVARPSVPSTFSYLCLPPSTQTRGSRSPRRSGTLAEVKGPFSNRQR